MSIITQGNLLADPAATPAHRQEQVDVLAASGGVRIERILSTGQASPPGFWYDQDQPEWVTVLSGAAELRLAEEEAPRRLGPGDWLLIPAHCRHRVDSTAAGQPTVWLAVFYPDA